MSYIHPSKYNTIQQCKYHPCLVWILIYQDRFYSCFNEDQSFATVWSVLCHHCIHNCINAPCSTFLTAVSSSILEYQAYLFVFKIAQIIQLILKRTKSILRNLLSKYSRSRYWVGANWQGENQQGSCNVMTTSWKIVHVLFAFAYIL